MDKYRKGIKLSLSLYKTRILLVCVMGTLLRVALPYMNIFMPKLVIDGITTLQDPSSFMLTVGVAVLMLVALNYLKSFSDTIINDMVGTFGIDGLFFLQKQKLMQMDYGLMDHPDFKAVDDKSRRSINSNHAPVCNIPRTLVELLSNVLGFLLYSWVVVTVHPLLLALLAATAAVNWLMLSRSRKYNVETREERSTYYRRISALRNTMRQPAVAKDIRLYNAFPWLTGVYHKQFDELLRAEKKVFMKLIQARLTDAAMILLRDGAAYAFLIYLVLNGRMTPGDFVFTFAAIGALAGWMSGILTAASDLSAACTEMCDVKDFLDFPDRLNTGEGVPLPTGDALPPSIELRNVSFTYPNAEKPTLDNISVTIKPGERLAVVGANGAGKTTLVKLLSGLCAPSEGEVLLAGHSTLEYNRDEYYTQIAAVFQDIYLLAASVAINVAQSPQPDVQRVKYCLELVGLAIDPDTLLVRAVHADARELSGGEKQKLAMARAIYKDAPVILLDEPTAALDPIAESEVYEKYAELTANKTSVYISHRLASTRFCDRILLIDGNTIAEEGTHDELMRLDGIYAKMFNIQASYYREEAAI